MTTSNPNNPRGRGHARAPYNFVPLPEGVIPAENDTTLPPHNEYLAERRSGYFDVTLTAETHLFIRGMLTTEETRANNARQANSKEEQKAEPTHFNINGIPHIPGSSLRGMLRTLIEIVTFSKIQPVSNTQKFFFRAVAAEKSDPLRDPYRDMIGAFSKHVRAGYLSRRGERWQIRPAQRFGKEAFAKVKDRRETVGDVRGMKRFNDRDYKLQVHPVNYEEGKGGRIERVYSPAVGEQPMAVLVCSGNMLETQSSNGDTESPRKSYALVMPPDRSRQPVDVPESVVRDYRDSLTPFVREQHKEQFNSDDGALIDGHPIFYIEDQGKVIAFGHTPNFRVPHLIWENGEPLAVTAHDCIPESAHSHQHVPYDYAEAMFGFVADKGDERGAYASRISVTSAELDTNWRKIFDQDRGEVIDREIPPRILASPKPTTFQHYLEQPQGRQTSKPSLHHYGSQGAQIRGHKLYWRKRIRGIEEVEQKDEKELREKKSQYTRIQPIKPKVRFTFKVYFDNLSDAELGALAWVLTLGNDPQARHMLGMGKPHGMGVVKLEPVLHLYDRRKRYTRLFDNAGWSTGEISVDEAITIESSINQFKAMIQQQTGEAFDAHWRIGELKTLLRLVTPSNNFDYMLIENQRKDNEFKDRPVLPYPSEIVSD